MPGGSIKFFHVKEIGINLALCTDTINISIKQTPRKKLSVLTKAVLYFFHRIKIIFKIWNSAKA